MSTLLIRLAGPLQAWGTRSRFAYRFTETQPSKSAVLGLVASAAGRRRSEPIEDLLGLRFGVRIDVPGTVTRDFQTARTLDGKSSMPLTYRYYLSDAVFLAGVEGEDEFVTGLGEAIRSPAFPLYLGRRSCPPSRPLFVGVVPGTLLQAFEATPWQASAWFSEQWGPKVEREVVLDAGAGEVAEETFADVPLSFDPNHREYALRGVVRRRVMVTNPRPSTSKRKNSTSAPSSPPRRRAWSARPGREAVTAHDPMGWWQTI